MNVIKTQHLAQWLSGDAGRWAMIEVAYQVTNGNATSGSSIGSYLQTLLSKTYNDDDSMKGVLSGVDWSELGELIFDGMEDTKEAFDGSPSVEDLAFWGASLLVGVAECSG